MATEQPTEGEVYVGLLENFASEIGSTLEDLVSDWNDPDYQYDSESVEVLKGEESSRTSSFKSQISMNSWDGMADLSLMKARPLSFANPVYDLATTDFVQTQSTQMTLIPLNQFDINKNLDGSPKGKQKHKKSSHGFMNKLSNLTMRKHSFKKQEPEMSVTAPLWTDVPSVTRSKSLKRTPSEIKYEAKNSLTILDEAPPRPMSLEMDEKHEKLEHKQPPAKLPRKSKGSYSPLSPNAEEPKIHNQSDSVFDSHEKESIVSPVSLELPANNRLSSIKSASSCGSLSSDLSEDPNLDDDRTTKTMLEVMNEISDDESASTTANQQNMEENTEEPPLLKRNKTLKWSGSRAAPALIREFTKRSKRRPNDKPGDDLTDEIPNQSVSDASPVNTPVLPDVAANTAQRAAPTNGQTVPNHAVNLGVMRVKASSSAPTTPNKRDSAFTFLSALLPPAPKLRRTESTKIRTYINRMGTNPQNALGYATMKFVKQTIQSTEHRPIVLLHSIRSFLTDIKRYLITNQQIGSLNKIHKIAKNITDVDGAIDDALEQLVLYPLRDHVYKCLVLEYARSGKIRLLEEAIEAVKSKTPQELGIRETLIPPAEEAMVEVKGHFMALQSTYSPYYKLKHLLSAVTTIYGNTTDLSCEDHSSRKIGADDFLPLLVYSIVKCEFTAADIEAQYIDGLLDPALLLGEGGYYLTTLISAVQVLCSMKRREVALPNISDLQGFLKVGISSKSDKGGKAEENSSESSSSASDLSLILHKTLHVPPSMTAHNLGMVIAKKYGIKQVKNFCLHVVVNSIAYPLKPQEFPQLVKMDLLTQYPPSSFYFVYRNIDKLPDEKIKTAEERPMTLNAEHLKVNTEEETQEEEKKESNQDGSSDEYHTPTGSFDDDNIPSTRGFSPPLSVIEPSNIQDDEMDVDALPPPPIDSIDPPDLTTQYDLPPPVELSPPDMDEPHTGAYENPPPPPEDLLPLPKNLEVPRTTVYYDSEDDIPPFETYESGERVDDYISSSGSQQSGSRGSQDDIPRTGSISNTTENNNKYQDSSEKTMKDEETKTQDNLEEVERIPLPPDVGSGNESEYEDSLQVSHGLSKLSIEDTKSIGSFEQSIIDVANKYDQEESSEDEKEENSKKEKEKDEFAEEDLPPPPSITVTEVSVDQDANLIKKEPENERNSPTSSYYTAPSSSDGYHSDGRRSASSHSDDSSHPEVKNVGANASVATLKGYFEEKIYEVAQDAARGQSPGS